MKENLLQFKKIINNPDLVPKVIFDFVSNWGDIKEKEQFLVAEINPQYANGIDLCNHYNINKKCGINCLIVVGTRGENKTYVACLVPVGYKYDMSKTVRKEINARMVSVAPLDFVLEKTKMEYGSITPVGLPKEWLIFIDPMVLKQEHIIIGGGYKNVKISLPSKILLKLPNAKLLDNLAKSDEV